MVISLFVIMSVSLFLLFSKSESCFTLRALSTKSRKRADKIGEWRSYSRLRFQKWVIRKVTILPNLEKWLKSWFIRNSVKIYKFFCRILKVERQKSYKNPTQKSLFILKSLSNIVGFRFNLGLVLGEGRREPYSYLAEPIMSPYLVSFGLGCGLGKILGS